MTSLKPRNLRTALLLLAGMALLFLAASPAAAQNDKKKKKNAPATDTSAPGFALPDTEQIDIMISEMLGAWQVGDIEKLHKTYADDVSTVNGAWGPPIIGWNNYLELYKKQHARTQQVRLDRSNTYIRVNGNFAWACYQWDFTASFEGQPTESVGQTTLVLEKRNNHWVIVHNHTALIQTAQPQAPASTPPTPQPQPAKPAAR